MLDNSIRGLQFLHKHLLYKIYIMLIILYGFQLWYFKDVSLFHSLKKLNKIQCRVVFWITGAFCMFSIQEVEAIAGLNPIYLHLNKISERYHLRVVSLPKQHAINSLLNNHHSKNVKPYHLLIDKLIDKQYLKIKSLIVDTNNCLNQVHPLFNRHYKLPRFH